MNGNMLKISDLHHENEQLKAQIHSQQHYIKQLENAYFLYLSSSLLTTD